MFGEDNEGESPRMPSPWRVISSSKSPSPSPLALGTPTSVPSTPILRDHSPILQARTINRNSLDGAGESLFAIAPGFEADFEALSFEDEHDELSVTPLTTDALPAEVDKSGHIEYKLKLLSPTPLRLAKLTTQLKWRLVEGGGQALYELGVLDNGTLVGLNHEEMSASLETLGRCLSGLGGGEVRVGRVVQVSGSAEDAAALVAALREKKACNAITEEGDDSSSSGSGSDGDTISKRRRTRATSTTFFTSFHVEAAHPNEHDIPIFEHSSSDPIPMRKVPHPERTPEERAELKRAKRDARRARRESDDSAGAAQQQFKRARLSGAVRALPAPAVNATGTEVTKVVEIPVNVNKPAMAKDGEVRFVVEACVMRKKLRADEDDEEEEGEGWRFLEFDFMGSAKSKMLR